MSSAASKPAPAAATTGADTVLYVNNNGMVACPAHGGAYLAFNIERNGPHKPGDEIVTPLDHWIAIDPTDPDWADFGCETCEDDSRRATENNQ